MIDRFSDALLWFEERSEVRGIYRTRILLGQIRDIWSWQKTHPGDAPHAYGETNETKLLALTVPCCLMSGTNQFATTATIDSYSSMKPDEMSKVQPSRTAARPRRRERNPAVDVYPPVQDSDLLELFYPKTDAKVNDSTRRTQLERAREGLDAMAADGYCVTEETPGPFGDRAYRILPTDWGYFSVC